jgi:hypothetical protein
MMLVSRQLHIVRPQIGSAIKSLFSVESLLSPEAVQKMDAIFGLERLSPSEQRLGRCHVFDDRREAI